MTNQNPNICINCGHEMVEPNDWSTDFIENMAASRNKTAVEPQDWEKSFAAKIDLLFIPPNHAGNPPITDWDKWMSKELYGHFKEVAISFITSLLSQRDKELVERAKKAKLQSHKNVSGNTNVSIFNKGVESVIKIIQEKK